MSNLRWKVVTIIAVFVVEQPPSKRDATGGRAPRTPTLHAGALSV